MAFKNTKEQGNVGIGVAVAWGTSRGYIVSLPISDSQPYDLIFDINGSLKKIQVKTSWSQSSSGAFEVELRTTGGNKSRNTYKPFNNSEVDFLFILTANGEEYFIPSGHVSNTNSMKVGGSG